MTMRGGSSSRITWRSWVDECLFERHSFWYQILLQTVGQHCLDAPKVGIESVRQGIAHQRHEPAVLLVVRGVPFPRLESLDVRLLRVHESGVKGAGNPGMLPKHFRSDHNQPMNGIDRGVPKPIGFGLGEVF